MSELVTDCPRCGAQSITFDIAQLSPYRVEYDWKYWYESYAICKKCSRATIFVLSDLTRQKGDALRERGLGDLPTALNNYVNIEGHVSIADLKAEGPPDHLPQNIDSVFREGAKCLAIRCYNAAGAMFRLCIDLATRAMLPDGDDAPNAKIRRNLGLRLPWLFDNSLLPEGLRELSTCVKDDGNDGAHDGTLTEPDAKDLLDLTFVLLERIYTEPERLRLAKLRREKRRESPGA